MSEVTENLGDIVIAPEVLEVIIGIAASKVEGVYSLRSKRAIDSIGKQSKGQGVYIATTDEGQALVDLYVYLVAGARVPEVAQHLQKDIKEAVKNTTEVEIAEVNIHVMGIAPSTAKKPDFDDLFEEGFFDAE